MVNRVHPEHLKVWHNGDDYRRIEHSLRAIEREMGLRAAVMGVSVVQLALAPSALRVVQAALRAADLVRAAAPGNPRSLVRADPP